MKFTKKIIYTDYSDPLLRNYLRDIAKYKIYSQEEINELINKAHNGDTLARELVIKSNLRFVVTLAKQFQNRGIALIDLISSGNLGLIKAVDKFIPEKNTLFLTYAIWWIKQAIYNTIYWHSKEIRLPLTQQLAVISIIDSTNKFIQKYHRNPSSVELSELTEIPVKDIDYLSQFFNKMISTDDFIGGDEDNSQFGDILPNNDISVEDEVNNHLLYDELNGILDTLSVREHDVLCLIYGFGVPKVNSNIIADMYGVGRERIRQIKESALNKIRKFSKNKLKKLV